MDFIIGLPRATQGYDSIWVIIDRLTKSTHFLPVRTIYLAKQYAERYLTKIVCLHGVSQKIVTDRGSVFTSKFWQALHSFMDTELAFSSTYHPQTGGQTERVN